MIACRLALDLVECQNTGVLLTDMPTAINDRAEALLKALIHRYVFDGQPVGSRTLAREAGLEISPATVRNVMSDLEELGLIVSPHTSAGRIPTHAGYRLFVDTIMNVRSVDSRAIDEIGSRLNDHDPNQLVSTASELLSRITHFAGVVLVPGNQYTKFKRIEFLTLSGNRVLAIVITDDGRVQNKVLPVEREYSESELAEAANFFNDQYADMSLSKVKSVLLSEMRQDSEAMNQMMRTAWTMAQEVFQENDSGTDDVVVSGEENLLDIPDLCDLEKLRKLFDTFKTKRDLLDLLDKSMAASGINIFIGDESGYNSLNDCSVVTAPYEIDGQCIGVLGVVGPTRMAYEDVVPVVDVTARLLGSALGNLSSDSSTATS